MIRKREAQLLVFPEIAEKKKQYDDKQYSVFLLLFILLMIIVTLTMKKWSVCC